MFCVLESDCRGADRIEFEDVIGSTLWPRFVAGPVFLQQIVAGLEVLVLIWAVVEVGVAIAITIASLAPRGTAVGEPEARLAVVANVRSVSATFRNIRMIRLVTVIEHARTRTYKMLKSRNHHTKHILAIIGLNCPSHGMLAPTPRRCFRID